MSTHARTHIHIIHAPRLVRGSNRRYLRGRSSARTITSVPTGGNPSLATFVLFTALLYVSSLILVDDDNVVIVVVAAAVYYTHARGNFCENGACAVRFLGVPGVWTPRVRARANARVTRIGSRGSHARLHRGM